MTEKTKIKNELQEIEIKEIANQNDGKETGNKTVEERNEIQNEVMIRDPLPEVIEKE